MQEKKSVPFVCVALVTLNIVMYIACNLLNIVSLDFGELSIFGVFTLGQKWRLITSMFMHANFEHLFNNMLLLFFLGAMIENGIGHIIFGLIYLLSGIGGNICSLIFKLGTQSLVGSIGASGAIFGLDGLLLAICLLSKNKNKFPYVDAKKLLFVIALSLYSGIRTTNIDNAAHFGGLAFGFIFGAIYVLIDNKRKVRG